MATLTYADVIADIDKVAKSLGVNSNLALAISYVESGLDPNIIQSGVPSNEAGVGLYQLTPGGELGSLTTTQAQNPTTNATIALSEVKAVAAKYPNADPGAVAFLAQRPQALDSNGNQITPYPSTPAEADQTQYAQDVNTVYQNIAKEGIGTYLAGGVPGGAAGTLGLSAGNAVTGDTTGGGVTEIAGGNPLNALTGVGKALSGSFLKDLLLALEFIGGVAALWFGAKMIFGTTGIPEVGLALVGAGSLLIWCTVRLQNVTCVLGEAVSGKTASCKLASTGGFIEGLVTAAGAYLTVQAAEKLIP